MRRSRSGSVVLRCPSASIFHTRYDSQGSIFGRQGSCSVPTERTVAEIVRLASSTTGPFINVTLDSLGSNRMVRAFRYFARDVTSFVGVDEPAVVPEYFRGQVAADGIAALARAPFSMSPSVLASSGRHSGSTSLRQIRLAPPTDAVAEPSGARAVYLRTVTGRRRPNSAGSARGADAGAERGGLQPVPATRPALATGGRRVRRAQGSSAAERAEGCRQRQRMRAHFCRCQRLQICSLGAREKFGLQRTMYAGAWALRLRSALHAHAISAKAAIWVRGDATHD